MESAANWQRVRALFHDALDRPLEERTKFLEVACADDENLRREVESLLVAEAGAAGFMESPAHRLAAAGELLPVPAMAPGDRVGDFEVIGPLGSGGMGEVYRARDVKLRREVALKLLPPGVGADPQRLARFTRESRILAALSHPNIAAIHSVEHVDGLHVLVLELVEGPTLADRLGAGALPPREALAIARELALALEAAHERGIVHRDLKPANIKLPPAAGVKLLDFGIAKEHVPVSAGQPHQPDTALERTTDGLILGTCAYMSPEQARGKPVDKRTDIWAFGCVLFEMLTGTRAFDGETRSDTIAAVLERAPNWGLLPEVPQAIGRLLRRCLEKDVQQRLHDIADARLEIEDALQPAAHVEGVSRPIRYDRVATFALLVLLLLAAGYMLRAFFSLDHASPCTVRFAWNLPAGTGLVSAPAVSPDGRHLAFAATTAGGGSRLFVRALHEREARAITGTEGAKQPFWSPDGRSLGFFARRKLMRVALDGGAPVEICDAPDGRGGTWNANGTIVFGPDIYMTGLLRVSANGGKPEPLTVLDREQAENSHRWPWFLPDGVHFLYFVRALSPDRRGVYLGRVDRPATVPGEPLFRSESEAVYVALGDGGALLSVDGGQVHVRPFDAARLRITGDPRTIDLPAGGNTPYQPMMVSASEDVIAHVASAIPYGQRLASSQRSGEGLEVSDVRETLNWVRLSPDGKRLAFQRLEPAPGTPSLWVEDLERGTKLRVTKDGAMGALPVWSPDGRRLAYVEGSFLNPRLVIAAADGIGTTQPIACPVTFCYPTDWTRDGEWLVATINRPTGADVWLLSTTGQTSKPLLAQPFAERDARISPDGRLIAYVSEETGQAEVSVQTVSGEPGREVVSAGGGSQPVWSRDGAELLFVDPSGRLRSTRIGRDARGRPTLAHSVGQPVLPIGSGHLSIQYDVSADGRIYFLDRRIDPPPSTMDLVVGWRNLLPN